MGAASSIPGARRFRLADLRAVPWRNGAGRTREIASGGTSAEDAWTWRFSVADLDSDAAFSLFPGVQRTALLLGDHPVQLRAGDELLHFVEPGDLHIFDGDTAFDSQLTHGATRLFNAMAKHGSARIELVLLRDEMSLTVPACVCALWQVVRGRFHVDARGAIGHILSRANFEVDEGALMLHSDGGVLDIEPLADGACLLLACVHAC